MNLRDLWQEIRTDLFKPDEDYRRKSEERYELEEFETGSDDDEDESTDWDDDWHNDPRND